MAELATSWMGLALGSPLVVAASPISRDPGAAALAVDAGAGAVVMHSLFEEDLVDEQVRAHRFLDTHADMNAEASRYMPDTAAFGEGLQAYLGELRALRQRLAVPIVASLNGTTPGGWVAHARALADAGADAIELNLYDVSVLSGESARDVEARQIDLVAAVVAAVGVPVTVKLSPAYTALPAFVHGLAQAGARGVTLFNRVYEPAVDLDTLEVRRVLALSSPADLPPRLHALAVLSGTCDLALACSGGVHDGADAARAILCGAHVVQLASALLRHGPAHVGKVQAELNGWLDAQGYTGSAEARAVLSMDRVPDPTVWTRVNYLRSLQSWPGTPAGRRRT
jgi:dihydroorotate dehydrogenase (fumarate)